MQECVQYLFFAQIQLSRVHITRNNSRRDWRTHTMLFLFPLLSFTIQNNGSSTLGVPHCSEILFCTFPKKRHLHGNSWVKASRRIRGFPPILEERKSQGPFAEKGKFSLCYFVPSISWGSKRDKSREFLPRLISHSGRGSDILV